MNEDNRKKYAVKLLYSITPDNVEQIYNRNFTRYLFENSDEVTINGKVYGNSFEDKITRACFMFPNEQGESNIKTASGCNTKGGFPLTELDFINNQLDNLKDLSFSDLVQRKKYETYLNFIQNKKTPPQPEPIFDEKEPTKNLDTIIRHYETFKGNLFLNGKNRLKAFEMLDKHTSHKDILKPHLAIQELKKLITITTFKDTAKYYLDKAKQVRKSIEDLVKDLIDKNILEPFDYNQFNIDVLRHLDTFIIEVEKFTGLSESEPPTATKKEIELQIEPFNPEIFKDQRSFNLFLFLVNEYATTKQPKQFSQIYHWMQENKSGFIKPNTGVKYQKFVRERFPEMVAKFSRIDIKNHNETPTLNELEKNFNSLNKV